jgi:hypothetical protein
MFKNWSKGAGVGIDCELDTVTDTEYPPALAPVLFTTN